MKRNVVSFSTYKYRPYDPKSQHRNKKSFMPSQDILESLEEFFGGLSKASRDIFSYLLWCESRYEVVCPSQGRIGLNAGVSRQYANQILARFEKLGLIRMVYNHMRSSYYQISHVFKNPFITSRLSAYFKLFRLQSLLVLTQVIEELKVYKNINISSGLARHLKFGLQHISTAGVTMESIANKNPSSFSPYLREISPKIGLTLAGEVRMSVFTDAALKHAYQCYCDSTKTLTGDYARWLWACARTYSEANNLPMDWQHHNRLQGEYKIPHGASLTQEISSVPLLERNGFTTQSRVVKEKETTKGKTNTPSKPHPAPKAPMYQPWQPAKKEHKETLPFDEYLQQKLNDPNLSSFERMLLTTCKPPGYVENNS